MFGLSSEIVQIQSGSILENGLSFSATMAERSKDLTEPKSFKDIFGDLSEAAFIGDLNLAGINLCSLEGCPYSVLGGFFAIEDNLNLESLDYFPRALADARSLFINVDHIKFFENPHIETIIKISRVIICLNKEQTIVKVLPELTPWLKEFQDRDTDFLKRVHIYSTLMSPLRQFDSDLLERSHKVYCKVGGDQGKFLNAVELLYQ